MTEVGMYLSLSNHIVLLVSKLTKSVIARSTFADFLADRLDFSTSQPPTPITHQPSTMSPSSSSPSHIHSSFPLPGVLQLTLNRSPVNAFNDSLWFELGHLCDKASQDVEVRCVVLCSGLEKVWTAGLDLT